jgi:predicted HTH domain antitoxin
MVRAWGFSPPLLCLQNGSTVVVGKAAVVSQRTNDYLQSMTIILPDQPGLLAMSEAELRLELACALYSRGKIGKLAGAELAGVDFFTFQGALGERGIASYTTEMLQQDVQTLIPAPR